MSAAPRSRTRNKFPLRRPWRRLWCERLEDRTVPSTFTVLNTNDAGPGSFRQAILDANANPGYDTIAFSISGSGVHTIQPLSQLPDITDTAGVLIDGYTQPRNDGSGLTASANTHAMTDPDPSDNAVLLIELDGSNAGSGAVGLSVTGGNSTIQGLVVNQFGGDGIHLWNAGGDTVRGNLVGTDPTGTAAAGNGGDGIHIDSGSSYNTIGGSSPDGRNIISSNAANGVLVTDATTTGNVIQGNYIGTDATGMSPLGNNTSPVVPGTYGNAGIHISDDGNGNIIGGTATGAGNLISGNLNQGILFTDGGGPGDRVQGNLVGVNAAGTGILFNGFNDVTVYGYSNLTIGGTEPGAGNIMNGSLFISGNGAVLQGNYFGTNPAGTAVFPNGGIDVYYSSHVLIGGTAPGAGNVIAGAIAQAIRVRGDSYNDVIQGNYIGTNPAGAVLGNTTGIYVGGAATDTLIGGTAPGAGNVIGCSMGGHGSSGVSTGYGIAFDGSDGPGGSITSGNVVQGNFIGTNAAGANLGNAGYGVVFYNYNQFNNTIGGTDTGAGNTIAFNGGGGVWLWWNAGTGNSIRGNSIHDNGGLGIHLYWNSDGPTLNDSVGHVGPNDFQNFPVLTSAVISGGATAVTGTLTSTPCSTFALDFYANAGADPSGYGQGEIYLGAVTVQTDANGNVTFTSPLPTLPPADGISYLSATATNLTTNDTSEFSADLAYLPTTAVSTTSLQQVLTADNPFPINVPADPGTVGGVVQAIDDLAAQNVTVSGVVNLNLASGTYSGETLSIPAGMTLFINGAPSDQLPTTIDPATPAFTVLSGTVVVSHVTFVTTGNAPTIQVSGGNLALRNDTVQSSVGASAPAIAVSGGSTVDLGTAASPGGNTINVNGTGPALVSTGVNFVSATGNTFQASGVVVAPPVATVGLTSSADPSVLDQPVTFTATVSVAAGAPTPTGVVTFVDRTTGAVLGNGSLAGNVARLTVAGLAVGGHTIAAVYNGDVHYITASTFLNQQVHYHFSGFLPPLAEDGSYHLGRTLPIKFLLTDYYGNFTSNLSAVVSLQIRQETGPGQPVGPAFNPAAAGGTGLRYDPTSHQFVFNWDTSGLTTGWYQIVLTLADGTTQTLDVWLK
jgi:hypothetical protein